MPAVTCPTCGERGKIAPNLVGARIKCRKCGVSFMVSPPAAKAQSAAGAPETAAAPAVHDGIEVEGLDESAWSLSTAPAVALAADASGDAAQRAETSGAFVAADPSQGRREDKLLTPRDKFFDGKYEFARLEEAINFYGRQGWVVKAMTTPHVKGFSGALEEIIVVLLER